MYYVLFFFSLLMSGGLFAQGEEAAPSGSPFSSTLIMIVIAVVFFYFIMWRPEQKRRKEGEQRRNSLQKGDKVTAMGIVGIVSNVKEETVIVKMYDGAKIEFLKGAITDVKSESNDDDKKVSLTQEK